MALVFDGKNASFFIAVLQNPSLKIIRCTNVKNCPGKIRKDIYSV